MGIFKEDKVNFNGKEYLEYIKYKDLRKKEKPKLSKSQMVGVLCLLFSLIGIMIIGILIEDITYVPQPSIWMVWFKFASSISHASWDSIGKFLAVLLAPFVMIAWIIHGVGFHIVKVR